MLKKRVLYLFRQIIFWFVIFGLLTVSAINFSLLNLLKNYENLLISHFDKSFYFSDQIGVDTVKNSELMYWFEVINLLTKELQITGVYNVVLNARIASLYKEVSSLGKNKQGRNSVVYRFLLKLYPHSQIYLDKSLENIGIKNTNLSQDMLVILNKHLKEHEDEIQKVYIANNKFKETSKWKLIERVGEPRKPESPGSGNYTKHFDYSGFEYNLQEPKYNYNNYFLNLEISKLQYRLKERNLNKEKLDNVLFWNAGRGAQGLAYIFQKKLYDDCVQKYPNKKWFYYLGVGEYECDQGLLDKQVFLANLIADAYVFTFENKYKFQTLRPEQVIKNYENEIKTPKQPAFPNEHAVICGAVAQTGWFQKEFIDSCIDSRYYAGVEFEEDILEGVKLGSELSRFILRENKI